MKEEKGSGGRAFMGMTGKEIQLEVNRRMSAKVEALAGEGPSGRSGLRGAPRLKRATWARSTMLKWLSRRGWEVTGEWPSGRVRIRWYKGKLFDCANLRLAFETIHGWWDARGMESLWKETQRREVGR